MNFHSISLVFTLKTIVEEQICAINEVIGYTWAIAQFPQSGKQETPSHFIFKNSINSFGRSLFFKEYHHAKNRAAYRVYLYRKITSSMKSRIT